MWEPTRNYHGDSASRSIGGQPFRIHSPNHAAEQKNAKVTCFLHKYYLHAHVTPHEPIIFFPLIIVGVDTLTFL